MPAPIIPPLIMLGGAIYKVAKNPATQKLVRNALKLGKAKKIKKPTDAQIKKAKPLTRSDIVERIGNISKRATKSMQERRPIVSQPKTPVMFLNPALRSPVEEIVAGATLGLLEKGPITEKVVKGFKKMGRGASEKIETGKRKKHISPPKSVRRPTTPRSDKIRETGGGKGSKKKYAYGGRVAKYKD